MGEFGAGDQLFMLPVPYWPSGEGPRLEMARLQYPDGTTSRVNLWWGMQGKSWIPLHPMEYPVNRLKRLVI
jgi:hypothetical protein